MSAESPALPSAVRRRSLVVAVGIALATVQGAVLAVIAAGRLAPAATAADVPWFGVWFAYVLAGAIVLERVLGSVIGWLLCVVGSVPGYAFLLELWTGAGSLSSAMHLVIPPLLLIALPAAFPDGLGRSRVRRVCFGLALVVALVGLGSAWLPGDVVGVVSVGVLGTSAVGGLILVADQVRRLRQAPQPRRAQHAIFLGGFAAAVFVMLLGAAVSALPMENASGEWVQLVGLVCLPAGVVIAMLGTGLWGTDLARGRRLLHVGAVTLVSTLLGVLLVIAIAGLAGSPVLAATVAVAGAAVALAGSWWLWRWLDRRLYGLGISDPTDPSAGDAAQLVAAALRAPEARITTQPETGPPGALVLALGRERWLVVHPRRPGESFTRRDRRVAERMAAGLAVHLDRADLQRSLNEAQAALATQRHREQQRLRAALHDTVGPLLVGAEMQARALHDQAGSAEAEDLHDALRQAREAMRDVLDEGSPRALTAGLVPAVAELSRRWSEPPVTFDNQLAPTVSEGIDGPTAHVAYLIISEALANVSQHAQANHCTIRLSDRDGTLVIDVIDDGVGIDPDRVSGVGLASMRGRALERGGDVVITAGPDGTTVTASLPLGGVGT